MHTIICTQDRFPCPKVHTDCWLQGLLECPCRFWKEARLLIRKAETAPPPTSVALLGTPNHGRISSGFRSRPLPLRSNCCPLEWVLHTRQASINQPPGLLHAAQRADHYKGSTAALFRVVCRQIDQGLKTNGLWRVWRGCRMVGRWWLDTGKVYGGAGYLVPGGFSSTAR